VRYAQQTSVSVEKSRGEIERTLVRYGATSFVYGWQGDAAVIQFDANDRRIKFSLPLPDRAHPEFTRTPGGRRTRSPQDAARAWEQACRQRWRALALAIKAKLEAVDCGIATFEEEFFAHIVMPNGQTVSRILAPQIDAAYKSGRMPRLLLEGGAA